MEMRTLRGTVKWLLVALCLLTASGSAMAQANVRQDFCSNCTLDAPRPDGETEARLDNLRLTTPETVTIYRMCNQSACVDYQRTYNNQWTGSNRMPQTGGSGGGSYGGGSSGGGLPGSGKPPGQSTCFNVDADACW
ncbi:hypothetical protein [Silanimonas sp.]|jgi:hypothetical protein|uniref:hypothetical protein n=1 Tax=Silanimonas sp. TaxID=1929290 RepID=UPI0037C4F6E8